MPDETHDHVTRHGRPAPAKDRATDTVTFEEIRERAYELWERNHRVDGFEIEFWLLAERELRSERRKAAGDSPPTE